MSDVLLVLGGVALGLIVAWLAAIVIGYQMWRRS